MWARLINIFKYMWQNPIVQFACLTVVEGVYVILRKKTGKTISKYNKKSDDSINEAVADLIVGEDKSTVVAEEAKPKKSTKKKKVVDLEEEPRPKKTKKRTIKKLEEDKVAEDKPKRKRTSKRVHVNTTEEKSN